MKAVVCTQYGGPEVLAIQDLIKPEINKQQVLVRVKASSITRAESMMRQGQPKFARLFLGFNKPKAQVTGTGFAGIVEAVGADVDKFAIGDEVFGETTLGFGTNAEFVCVNQDGLIMPKPQSIEFSEAATLGDGALTAIYFLNYVIEPAHVKTILINGASGSIGTAAVQIAKRMNWQVTGVCSTANVELLKSLGADNVIDYTKDDFTTTNKQYDLVFDTIGTSSFGKCISLLSVKGTYLSPVLSLSLLIQSATSSCLGKKQAKFCATGLQPVKKRMPLLKKLITWYESGQFHSVMDKTYLMKDVVEAHKHVDTGHKKGNIALIH